MPAVLAGKARRAAKAVADTATSSSEAAAADPGNLKGKSSDDQPDGVQVRGGGRCAAVGCPDAAGGA